MQGLFMPYDHVASVANGTHDAATLDMMQTLNEQSCNSECTVGSGGASVGYLAHGTATDYMYEVLKVPVAMTWEIYGDLKAHNNDCFRMFNPLTSEAHNATVQRWSMAVLHTVLLMAGHPAVAHLDLRQRASAFHSRASQAEDASSQEHVTDAAVADGSMRWRPHPRIRDVAQLSTGSRLHDGVANAHGAVHADGSQHAAAQVPMYQPGRSMLTAAAFFVVTVVLWCIARRFMRSARVRKRLGVDSSQVSSEASMRQE
jgi:hypothetical protein